MPEAMTVIDRLDHESQLLATFSSNACKQRHDATYKGAAGLRLYTYPSSSGIAPRCQREKPKMLPQLSTSKRSPQSRYCMLRNNLPM